MERETTTVEQAVAMTKTAQGEVMEGARVEGARVEGAMMRLGATALAKAATAS